MDKLVDADLAEEREVGIAIARNVSGSDIVVGEVAEQRTLQPPLGIELRVGRNGAEVVGDRLAERQGSIATVHLRTDDFEVDGQAFLVSNNLRLLRHHADVGGIAIALIINKESKLGGLHRFYHIERQWVVAVDIALHEVGEVELGRRLHGERDGIELARYFQTGEGVDVAQRTAEGIVDRLCRSGMLRWYEEHGSRSCAVGCKRPSSIECQLPGEALQAFCIDLELMACGNNARGSVGDREVQLHILHGRLLVAVEHGERATEGLTGHHHLLRELQGDGGADGTVLFRYFLIAVSGYFLEHLVCVFVSHLMCFSFRLSHTVPCRVDDFLMDAVFILLPVLHIQRGVVKPLDECVELCVSDASGFEVAQVVSNQYVAFGEDEFC